MDTRSGLRWRLELLVTEIVSPEGLQIADNLQLVGDAPRDGSWHRGDYFNSLCGFKSAK